jgi:hypothetical protein
MLNGESIDIMTTVVTAYPEYFRTKVEQKRMSFFDMLGNDI